MDTRRNRLRWRGYDYATPRSYYVTLCIQGRRCLLGSVRRERVEPSASGRMVAATWRAIPGTFPGVCLEAFVVMPNHLHGILCLQDRAVELGTVVGWFKSRSTHAYMRGVRERGWPRFDRRLWQRGYYDRVLRDEHERGHATGYIVRNPRMWHEDPENPRRP